MESVPEVSNEQAVVDEQEAIIQQETAYIRQRVSNLLNEKISVMQFEHQKDLEEKRWNNERQMEMRRVKTDMVKVATDTLTSNARSKPVDARDVTALDIKTFADELVEFINQQ